MMRLSALGACALLCACDTLDSQPSWQLSEPRVLAVRTDPPVLHAGEQATLTALVVDGDGAVLDTPLTWRVCDPWRFVLDPEQDCGPGQSLELDGGVLVAADVLARFPAPAGSSEVPTREATPCGERVRTLPLVVVVSTDVGFAVRRVPLALEPDAPRRNPSLVGTPLVGAYAPGQDYELAVAVDPEQLDPFCADGTWVPEPVRVFVYTSHGALDRAFVDLAHDSAGPVPVEPAVWTAPAGGDAHVWLVAVDTEGGTDWQGLWLTERR